MSRTADGRCLHCDGIGCEASVPVPVLLGGVRPSPAAPPRWLFVQEQEAWKHYCPACALKIVASRRIRRFADSLPSDPA
ncbi:hypothetical protein [Armatimonas rosea]|uniref:Uncharacterized protein n=1 Tax=Armatimonas rosea TaxID=685828 RepID=A0A7W9W704_ARMRO|nr:hypothetical protein [Armatimonas rosea]MBB6051138.1 hypothetical protein [Armatimonas rosea]